ncbi:hypothetical protein RFM99_33050 [Mesorhizobium sp. VK4C]|uniref:hypothetical protein n=1 Tax=Mesorhizobium captivum TaxID=3072319 RepID=UPI002A2423E6|nr:hypothetical protein [Mesorhizobium sp. VK4C]MDX8503188.1 hypothetical protein [Mesorhizobium sp. VK4C]
MSPLSALNNAVLILQPQRPTSAAASVGDSLVASINRVYAGTGAGSPLTQAQARITESMFSVNNLDATQMKARLFERVGKEFGIDQDDYDSLFSYGSAIKTALDDLKQKSPSSIAEIEKKLGLDELSVFSARNRTSGSSPPLVGKVSESGAWAAPGRCGILLFISGLL